MTIIIRSILLFSNPKTPILCDGKPNSTIHYIYLYAHVQALCNV